MRANNNAEVSPLNIGRVAQFPLVIFHIYTVVHTDTYQLSYGVHTEYVKNSRVDKVWFGNLGKQESGSGL